MNESELQKTINFCKDFYKERKYSEFELHLLSSLENFPNNTSLLMLLADNYRNLNNFQAAEETYLKLIKLYPNEVTFYAVYGELLYYVKLHEKALEIYDIGLSKNKNHALCLFGKAQTLNVIGKVNEAINNLNRALAIEPKFENALKLLGSIYKSQDSYKEALNYYDRIEGFSKERLECLYFLDEKDQFYFLLNKYIDDSKHKVSLASLSAHASIRYNKKDEVDFCKKPFEYIYQNNLIKNQKLDDAYMDKFIKKIKKSKLVFRKQELIENAYQTQGNILSNKNLDLDTSHFVQLIDKELKMYLNKFQSNESIIADFPHDYDLNAWFLIINNDGYVKPHIHERGWISGSIYLNIPPKGYLNEGNIKFSFHNDAYPKDGNLFPEKILDLKTGDIVLFPSSLFHSTIPIVSDEERVVLAFDIMPR